MKIKDIPGATPLDEETLQGLIPSLTTQSELNEFEAENIAEAVQWAFTSRKMKKDLLSATGLIALHKKMFDQTWKWAGTFRKCETNIGVDPKNIQSELAALLGDVKYWLENKTYPIDEIAIRVHHKLVWIHPFPNGNGRFSRLACDLLLRFNGAEKFEWGWGSEDLMAQSEDRTFYIQSLKRADKMGDYADLLRFARGK